MSNLDLYDWSTFTAGENAMDLLGKTIRKSLTSDFFNGKTRFRARALDDQMTLSALQSRGINASNTGGGHGESHAFRARIIDENSPHAFLPDPCDPAWSGTKQFTQRVIAMHTLFITSDQAESPRITRGDIVYVELEKSDNSYNLDKGTFLRLLSSEAPETSGQCFALKLSQLSLETAIPMSLVPKTDPICTRRDGKCADVPEEQKPSSPDTYALITESQAANWDFYKRKAELNKIRHENEALERELQALSKENNRLLETSLDAIGIVLDVIGLLGLCGVGEVVATPATVISLCLNLYRGDIFNALVDLIALIPVYGKAAKAGSLGLKGARAASAISRAIKASRSAGKMINYYEGVEGAYTAYKGTKALFGIIPPRWVAKLFMMPSGPPGSGCMYRRSAGQAGCDPPKYYEKLTSKDSILFRILDIAHLLGIGGWGYTGIGKMDQAVSDLLWFAEWVHNLDEIQNARSIGDPCDKESNPDYPEKCFIPPVGWEDPDEGWGADGGGGTIEDWLEEIGHTKEEYKTWVIRESVMAADLEEARTAKAAKDSDFGAPLIAGADGNVHFARTRAIVVIEDDRSYAFWRPGDPIPDWVFSSGPPLVLDE